MTLIQPITLMFPVDVRFPLPMQVGNHIALITESDVFRFMTMTKPDGDCLRFTRWVNPRTGYGMFGLKCQVNVLAHRFAYTVWRGPIPARRTLDHRCHNEAARAGLCPGGVCSHRACVWPWTLEPVTQAANLSGSGLLARSGSSHRNARKDQCDHGHAFTEANTYWWHGERHCRACRRYYHRALRAVQAGHAEWVRR